MSNLVKLTRQDIETRYLNKPILINCDNEEVWYIVSDVNTYMPLHMLSAEESDLYHENEDNISGIEVIGVEGGYLMWIYFETDTGWEAYGYE